MHMKRRWGIIATGNIAHSLANGIRGSKTSELHAVASRSQEKADAFAREFGVPKSYGSYEALLADPDVEIIYVAVPHPMHAEWAIKAANAGKHVLVEKPAAMSASEAQTIIDAARANDVFLMEAFMYRCHPQMGEMVRLIKSGIIGQVRLIQTAFGFQASVNPESRLFSPALGGGAILDVGCYAASGARLVAGAALGKDFADPVEVLGSGELVSTGVDGWAVASLKFPGGILAQLATAIVVNFGDQNVIRVIGSEGTLTVPTPWLPSLKNGTRGEIILHRNGTSPERITFDADTYLYSFEVDTVAENIERRQAAAMSWDDTLGNMKVLDLWRQQVG